MADKISGTHIRLMSGIPFNSDYKHTRYFTTRATQSNYFDSFTVTYRDTQSNFIRTEGRFRYRVKENIENLHNTNYIRYFNQRPNGSDSRRIYGFVTHMEYVNIQATDIFFEIDVIQTYLMDCTWKHSFINREHWDFVMSMSSSNFDSEKLIPTMDEGLYYGNEYHINKVEHVKNGQDMRWLVIVASDPLHGADGEEYIDSSYVINPQPLYYYVVPFTPDGESKDVVLDGSSKVYKTSNPGYTIRRLAEHAGTVDHVVSMYVTDDIGIRLNTVSNDYLDVDTTGGWEFESHMLIGDNADDSSEAGGYALFVKNVETFTPNIFTVSDNVWADIRERYGYPTPVTISEHKLLMSPYHIIELHDYRGNVVKINPEGIRSQKLTIARKGSLGISNKVGYSVRYYNHDARGVDNLFTKFEQEFALVDNNPNDITIKNEHLASFIQGNRNQLQHQQSQALISGVFSTANAGIGVSGALEESGRAYGMKGGRGLPGALSAVSGGAQGLAQSAMVIAEQQAKKSDLANIPPSIDKMGGNTEFDIGYGLTGVFVVFKGPRPEYVRTINDYFHAFGYKTMRLKVPNRTTRKRFNYVHTNEANIVGNINNTYIQQLKDIFNSGITLWHVNNVADYSGDNGSR